MPNTYYGLRRLLATPLRCNPCGQFRSSDAGGAWLSIALLPDHGGIVLIHHVHELVRHLTRGDEDLEPSPSPEPLEKRDAEVAGDRARQRVADQASLVGEDADLVCCWSGSLFHLALYCDSTSSCWPSRGK